MTWEHGSRVSTGSVHVHVAIEKASYRLHSHRFEGLVCDTGPSVETGGLLELDRRTLAFGYEIGDVVHPTAATFDDAVEEVVPHGLGGGTLSRLSLLVLQR